MKQILKSNKILSLAFIGIISMLFNSICAISQTTEDYDRLFLEAQHIIDSGECDKAIKLLNEVDFNKLAIADDTTKAVYHTLYGKSLLLLQKYDLSLSSLKHAVDYCELAKIKLPIYLDVLSFNAYANDCLGNRDEALKWYRKVLIKGRTIEHNPDLDNCCYLNIGNIYNERGKYEEAAEFYSKIQWIDTLQRIEPHEGYWGKMANKYVEYGKSGRWDLAKSINDSLIGYSLVKYGETHPFYLSCMENEGTIQTTLQNYNDAAITYKKIIDIGKKHDMMSNYIGSAYIRLIEIYCNQDMLNEANEIFPAAVDYLIALKDPNYSEVELCLYIGTTYINNNIFDVGITALNKFLDFMPGYMKWGEPYAINKLSWAYLNTGRYNEVVDMLAPLISKADSFADGYKIVCPLLYKTLGCAYYFLERNEEAVLNFEKAISIMPEEMSSDTLIQEIMSDITNKN